MLADYCRRFVREGGAVVAGPVAADGRTDWRALYDHRGRRLKASPALVAEHLSGSWSTTGRLACQLPTEVKDIVLDFDAHAETPEGRQAQLDRIWSAIRRLAKLRIRLAAAGTPRGVRVAIPVDRVVDGRWLRNLATRVMRNQKLLADDEIGDAVRVGVQAPTGVFLEGGALLYVHGRGEVCEPLETPEQRARAFERYCAILPNRLDRLEELSLRERRPVGRPLGGAANSGDAPSGERGSKATTGVPRGGENPTPYFLSTSGVEGENKDKETNNLGSQSASARRDQISELLDCAGLGSWDPSAEGAGNSSKTRHELALLAEGLGPAELVPGTRRKVCFDLVQQARSAGWKPAEALARIWAWLLERPAGSSVDLDRNPRAVLKDLARTIADVYRWRERNPAKRRGPAVEPDPADLQALAERGIPRAMAKHVARIMTALRERREVGDELPLSREWMKTITGAKGKSTLSTIRKQLLALGIVEEVQAPDRRKHLATTCVVRSLQVRQAPVILHFVWTPRILPASLPAARVEAIAVCRRLERFNDGLLRLAA